MKNSLIKRSVTGVLAVAMVFSSYSCGGKKNDGENSSNSQAEQTAKEVIKNSYNSIDIETEIPAEYVEQMFLIKGTSQVLITGGDSNGNTKLYLTDVDFSGFNEISLDFEKPENSQSYMRTTVAPDGSVYVLLTVIDYGTFKLPDYDDPNFDYEDFDYEAMNEAAEYSYTLYKLASDGSVISENPVTNIEKYSEDSENMVISVRDITACSDGNIILSLSGEKETYCIMNENGEITGKIDVGSDTHWINYFGNDSDGNVVCAGYGSNGEALEYIDIEAKKFSDDSVNVSLENSEISGINSISTGTGEYTLFTSTQTGLYGIDKDKKPVEIINWIDSDISGDSVRSVIGLDDGDFIVYLQDYTSNTSGFARLTKRSADELANQTVITVGMLYSDSSITSQITEFNKSQTDYRIKVADYSKYDEYDGEQEKMINSASKQLKMDIVSGNAPDMIITYDYNLISELAPKGTFADLSTYLEKDADLSEDDIMPNVLSASKIDGKLYSLSPNFSVSTLVCKTKFFDKENWTLDEMIDTYREHPDMQLYRYGNSKETIFELVCSAIMDDFIDYEKAECNFDSDDFKKILEFCNEFPDEDEEIDWDNATQDEMDAYWNEQDTLLLSDKALLDNLYISEFTEYGVEKDVYFGGEDITLVGMPSDSGKGAKLSFNNSMAVLESSPSKDACWSFIKEFFTEEYQTNKQYFYALPSLTTAFEKKADESMSKPYYLDEDGKKVEYDNTYFINNKEINVKPLTQKERDFIVDYVKQVDEVASSLSDDVRDIVVEEVTKYFKGEADSKQTVDKIQSRVGILISEQS